MKLTSTFLWTESSWFSFFNTFLSWPNLSSSVHPFSTEKAEFWVMRSFCIHVFKRPCGRVVTTPDFDHEVPGSNPARGGIQQRIYERPFIAQSTELNTKSSSPSSFQGLEWRIEKTHIKSKAKPYNTTRSFVMHSQYYILQYLMIF